MGLKVLGGRPARGTTGHQLGATCVASKLQRVQDDMNRTVGEQGLGICLEGDRDLAGKICVGILHGAHTPRLGSQTGVVSTEDTDEIWKSVKEEVMEKVKGRANRQVRADSPMIDEAGKYPKETPLSPH